MNKLLSIFFITIAFVAPAVSFAQNFVPLTEDLETGNMLGGYTIGDGMEALINRLFVISVAVSAVLAVIVVSIGGFKYMTSESVFKTSGAKEQIANAIVGLIIVLVAVVILNTINPEITSLNIFKSY